jgi:hypothetical protein
LQDARAAGIAEYFSTPPLKPHLGRDEHARAKVVLGVGLRAARDVDQLEDDITSPYFGIPRSYTVNRSKFVTRDDVQKQQPTLTNALGFEWLCGIATLRPNHDASTAVEARLISASRTFACTLNCFSTSSIFSI